MLLILFLVLNFLIFNSGDYVLAKNHLKCFSVEAITNEGEIVWSCTYGKAGSDRAKTLIQIADGYGLAVDVENPEFQDLDAWFIKTDPVGDVLWIQKYHWGWMTYVEALIHTTDGGFALAGRTLPSRGEDYMWLAKTDANGTIQWLQTYEGILFDSGVALVQNQDEGFSLAGSTSLFEARKSDMWLVRTDTNGSVLWNQTYGGSEDDGASALIQTTDGGLILAGSTKSLGAGGYDMWLVKTDATGTPQWNYTYGGEENDFVYTLIETADGGFALAGSTRSVGAGGDMCLIKTNGNGTIRWIQTQGGPSTEFASAVIQTLDGYYVLAGTKIWATPGRENPTSSDI